MMTLQQSLRSVAGPDQAAAQAAKERLDGLAKPLGSLGMLEKAVIRIAALTGSPDITLRQRSLLVFCADNGVTAQGVSQSDAGVTAAVAAALGRGTSTVNYMAAVAGCTVIPADIGMSCSPEDIYGVLNRRIRSGTADISRGPAMTGEECIRAIETGIDLVRERREAGDQLLLLGEMGIGNTTTSCAVTGVLLGLPPEQLAGKGAGLSEAGLARKIRVIRQALQVNRPDPDDPVDVLQKVGGLDLAALCGAMIGGALYRIPILLDGIAADAAALCAVRLCPDARNALLASHVSAEPAARALLAELSLDPLICAGMRLGEGSGAVAALPLLDMVLAVYNSGHTFDRLGIEPYTAYT